MTIISKPSPNFNDRKGHQPSIILIHYTGMETEEAALGRLCDPQAEVSAHYTINRDGVVYNHVDIKNRAWHAGQAYWRGERDINSHSIGIELVNKGHEFGYEDFPDAQIDALISLSLGIQKIYEISDVLAHSDVAPTRKEDPGERFPWRRLAESGIGYWPEAMALQEGDFDHIQGLSKVGYDMVDEQAALVAFQRHYVAEVFEEGEQGAITPLTVQRLKALIHKD